MGSWLLEELQTRQWGGRGTCPSSCPGGLGAEGAEIIRLLGSRGKESPRPGQAAHGEGQNLRTWLRAAAVNLAPSPRTSGEAEPSRGASFPQQDEHRGARPLGRGP